MDQVCRHCGKRTTHSASALNRAAKSGANLYCGRACAGMGRRVERTESERKEAKRLYDIAYRAQKSELLRVKKSQYYQAHRNPEKERAVRKARMHSPCWPSQ